jgi:hypothetical protein
MLDGKPVILPFRYLGKQAIPEPSLALAGEPCEYSELGRP